MHIERLPIQGALLVRPTIFGDDRGYFKEVYSAPRYRSNGIEDAFVQDNVSLSRSGVLRGLHGDNRMSKLVQVLEGEAFDVVVDLRPNSATFRKWHGLRLSGENHSQIYIPSGCLHGFLSLSDSTLLLYKQSAAYDPETEVGVAWDDPDLAIDWPLAGLAPLLSKKDKTNPTLRQLGYL
jgi:dTDP-4-dehydrorhamnose 3,5-epimerase